MNGKWNIRKSLGRKWRVLFGIHSLWGRYAAPSGDHLSAIRIWYQSSEREVSLVIQMAKNLPANAGYPGSIPGSGRSSRGGNGNPLQYSYWGNPTDPGAWWAPVTKRWTWLSNCACVPPYSTYVPIQSLIGIFNLLTKRNFTFSHKAENTLLLGS